MILQFMWFKLLFAKGALDAGWDCVDGLVCSIHFDIGGYRIHPQSR